MVSKYGAIFTGAEYEQNPSGMCLATRSGSSLFKYESNTSTS